MFQKRVQEMRTHAHRLDKRIGNAHPTERPVSCMKGYMFKFSMHVQKPAAGKSSNRVPRVPRVPNATLPFLNRSFSPFTAVWHSATKTISFYGQ